MGSRAGRHCEGRPIHASKAVGALHPLGHMGEPGDIAWGAVYPAPDEAIFVTGAKLVIDGGYTAR
jgi:NAD(P)-dependent dehydrogenase (short-subunit alcohol dehydrogenase family)